MCFGKMGKPVLTQLAKYEGCALDGSETLFQLLGKLIKFLLPLASDDSVLDILALRCDTDDMWQDLVQSEEAQDMLEVANDQEHKDTMEKENRKKNATLEYIKEFRARAKQVRGPRSKAKAKPKAVPKAKARPKPTIPDTITDVLLEMHLPDGYRIWADKYNGRWQLCRKGDRLKSRSWLQHGHGASAEFCLGWAWDHHQGRGGAPPPWQ